MTSRESHPGFQPYKEFASHAQQQNLPQDYPQYPMQEYTQQQYPQEPFSQQQDHGSQGVYGTSGPTAILVTGPHAINENGFRSITEEEEFSDKAVRAVFVRKVYTTLTVQLLFILAVLVLFIFEPHTKKFAVMYSFQRYISFAACFVVYLMLCCGNLNRKFPMNIILLTFFTVAQSHILGTYSVFFHTEIVLLTVGICAVVCFTIAFLSCITKFDFTRCEGRLLNLLEILLLFGIITIFRMDSIITTAYAAVGAVFYLLFLSFGTQMIMNGNIYDLTAEEHVFTALLLSTFSCLCCWCCVSKRKKTAFSN